MAAPANDNCVNAIEIYSGDPCSPNYTLSQSTIEDTEVTDPSCISGNFIGSTWFKFTATSTDMYVQARLVNSSNIGHNIIFNKMAIVVYDTDTPIPDDSHILECASGEDFGNSNVIQFNLTGLSIASSYLIQVGHKCRNCVNPQFCIQVGDNYSVVCDDCSSPCTSLCDLEGMSHSTTSDITNNCLTDSKVPLITPGNNSSQCYSFTPTNANITFGMVISVIIGNQGSNQFISTQNSSNFEYRVYAESDCNTIITSGDLTNMNINGLTPLSNYVLCFSLIVPNGITHNAYYPYIY